MSTLRTILITTTRQQALRTVLVNRGPSGIGIPTGGVPGQVIGKASETNFDTEWVDPTGGPGGTVDAAAIAAITHAATEKATPADNDEIGTTDSAASYAWKKFKWSAIKSALKSYFDGFYQVALTTYSTQIATLTGYPTTFPPTIGSGAADAVAGNDPAQTNARERVIHQINELDVLTGSDGDFIRLQNGEYVFTMDYPGNGVLWKVKANSAVVGEIIVHNRSAAATLDLYPHEYESAVSASILPGQTGVYVPSETGGAWVAIKPGGVLALVSDITRAAIGATATGSALITAATAAAAATAAGVGTTDAVTHKTATLAAGGISASAPNTITQIWTGTGTYEANVVNVTDSGPSNAASTLLDLKVGGVSKFSINKSGDLTIPSTSTYNSANLIFKTGGRTAYIGVYDNGGAGIKFSTSPTGNGYFSFQVAGDLSMQLALGYRILFGASATTSAGALTYLGANGAGVLEQQHSTASQAFRVYNTFTARGSVTTNLEALEFKGQAAGSFVIQSMKGSAGGTSRDIEIRHGATDTNGTITNGTLVATFGAAATTFNLPIALKSYAVGTVPAASVAAGATIYVSDESSGAVIAFSDGTNWRRVTDRAIIS